MAVAKRFLDSGEFKAEETLPELYFEAPISEGCLFLTINAYLANQRQGTHKAKGKSEVSGTGAKPWKQKGSGRARSGTNKSPIWVRGGKAHHPVPRDYSKKVNKKVKKIALLSALSIKAGDNQVYVFDSLNQPEVKTVTFIQRMEKAGLSNQKNLYLVSASDRNTLLCANNIPWARVMRVQDVNSYELMRATNIIFSGDSLAELTKENNA
jgi:large subunit ribosomal protein L4